jgi:hypothetical protein
MIVFAAQLSRGDYFSFPDEDGLYLVTGPMTMDEGGEVFDFATSDKSWVDPDHKVIQRSVRLEIVK